MQRSLEFCDFTVIRDTDKCIKCKVCVQQCSFGATEYYEEVDEIFTNPNKCVACQRCMVHCPTRAIDLKEQLNTFKPNAYWSPKTITNIYKQAATGGILLTGMGNDQPYHIYWEHMLLDACQVTNPSIDPLREPMELRTYLGSKNDKIEMEMVDGKPRIKNILSPQIKLEVPIMFSAMSYGAINYNAHKALAIAAKESGILYNTGEGGLHKDLYQYGSNTIVQVASGRFGVHKKYLDASAAIEIKIGQGAKPGIGGHLPGEKISATISETRMIPVGSDAISPAPHHDIYSIEDLRQLIYALKEATEYTKPVFVKIAAVHSIAAIASGVVRAGADAVVIDGFRGGTGAAPVVIRDNMGIPIEFALAAVDSRLRQEGIRNKASLIAAGGFRNSGDIIKAIALGADAVYIGTASLIAMGCVLCQKCYTGRCAWGIATNDPELAKRLNPDMAAERLINLIRAWKNEIKEMLGSMGINAIESIRGNRERLRGLSLSESELRILDIKAAGE